jgi:hypothetical protein
VNDYKIDQNNNQRSEIGLEHLLRKINILNEFIKDELEGGQRLKSVDWS